MWIVGVKSHKTKKSALFLKIWTNDHVIFSHTKLNPWLFYCEYWFSHNIFLLFDCPADWYLMFDDELKWIKVRKRQTGFLTAFKTLMQR